MSLIQQFLNSETINSEDLLTSLFDNSEDSIFILKILSRGRFEYSYFNDAFRKMIGRTDRITGTMFGENLPADSVKKVNCFFEKVILENRPLKTGVYLSYNSRKLFLNSTIFPLRNNENRTTHLLIVAKDDSEKRQIKKDFEKAKVLAEEADRFKTSLLSNMSHETRTPLNGIIGFAELLRDEVENDNHRDMVINILQSAKRLLSTLHSIIELSRLETSPNPVYTSKTDLLQLLNKISTPFENEAHKKGLYFYKDYSEAYINTHIDEYLFAQVICSVLENAIKFTNSGGISITVTTKLKDGVYFACIDITDTGIGIAEKDQRTIFEKFKQASSGFGRSYEGMGLGLTLAKLMTELMNGHIILNSTENAGTKIQLLFPAIRDHIEDLIQETNGNGSIKFAGKNKRLLLVEDNLYNQKLLSIYLRKNYEFDFAESGDKALTLLANHTYNAVLMDINLGSGLNGIDILTHLRQQERHKDIPVIATTGYAMPKDENQIVSMGFNAYLSKPYEKGDLYNLLNRFLEDTITV